MQSINNYLIFPVMGLCNLMHGYTGFTTGHSTFIFWQAVKIAADSASRTFTTMY